jgi:predicted DNA-binding protein with PD1-like motif
MEKDLYQISVGKGEEVKEKITEFILEKKWDAAVILGAIGSIQDVVYSTPAGTADNYHIERTKCEIPAELISFTGEIMKSERVDPALKKAYNIEGEYFVHIHASSASAGGQVLGGGFQRGHALRAVNVFIRQMQNN